MQRPFVSLIILTYNQKRFIRETLDGALSQNYENLEVIISDDGSTDGTFEEIKRIANAYNGSCKLIVNHNCHNIGLVRHVNSVMEMARGEYVMLSGGDDVCLPNTISTAVGTLIRLGLNSIACNMVKIDGGSKKIGLYCDCRTEGTETYTLCDYVKDSFNTSGACRVFKKDMHNVFGPFLPECPTEDSPNLLRTFLYGGVGYLFKPNIMYRIHGSNLSRFVSLMTRFDPRKIYSQYIHDLNTALDRGLVSQADYQLVEKKISCWLERQMVVREIFSKQTFLKRMFFALTVALRKGFSLKEAKNYCLQVLDWKARGL